MDGAVLLSQLFTIPGNGLLPVRGKNDERAELLRLFFLFTL